MRKKYNKINYGVSVVVILSSLMAFPVMAANNGNNDRAVAPEPKEKPLPPNGNMNAIPGGSGPQGNAVKNMANGDVCSRVMERAGQVEQRMSQVKSPEERLNDWQQRTTERDAQMTQLRERWSENRDAQFKALEANATTDQQKRAVADFETITKNAITTREAAVDAAQKTFRDGVKNQIQTRTQTADANRENLMAAVKTAFQRAQTDCQNNGDPATIRTTLRTALQSAKGDLQTGKQNLPKVGADIQPLIDARKSAVQKALDEFKATMEQARIALRKAFPSDTTSTSTGTDTTTTTNE